MVGSDGPIMANMENGQDAQQDHSDIRDVASCKAQRVSTTLSSLLARYWAALATTTKLRRTSGYCFDPFQ